MYEQRERYMAENGIIGVAYRFGKGYETPADKNEKEMYKQEPEGDDDAGTLTAAKKTAAEERRKRPMI